MTKTYRGLDKLHPSFKKKVELFMNHIDIKNTIFITESFRSNSRQQELYAKGRTTPGPKVTWVKHSNHQDGTAIDIAFLGPVLYPNNNSSWKKIGVIANQYGIDWGADLWNGKDKPHFQDNGKPLVIKKELMQKYGPNTTEQGLTYPSSVYGVKIQLTSEDCDRIGLLKLHGVNTKGKTFILLHPDTVRKGDNKVKEVIGHEFAHIIYHTILKTNIFEKINHNDMKLTKYEYWDFLSRNIKEYITKYASTHSAEDFAECIGYGYYIENNIDLPKKATWNNIIKIKYIIANNLYKRGLKKYITQNQSFS